MLLHRLAELNAKIRNAVHSHDWTGVYPAIHHFCATDLSAFYFDIRKDSLYCDRPDAKKRRACRSVLDILHRCLTAWLAPALPFTAEEAYCARFGDDDSVHLTLFPEIPGHWRNDALAEKWAKIREHRTGVTGAIEAMRRDKTIGSSLQAVAVIAGSCRKAVSVSRLGGYQHHLQCRSFGSDNGAVVAAGDKCERCWRVLPEVGTAPAHPTSACAAARLSGEGPSRRVHPSRLTSRSALADQLSKYWVLHGSHLQDGHFLVLLPVLNFVLVWNHGVTFGLFNGPGASTDHPGRVASVVVARAVRLAVAER